MISENDIEKLLNLARIEVNPDEKEKLRQDVEAILGYVGEVEKAVVEIDATPWAGELINIMREDGEPHQSGIFTESILSQAPKRERNYISVKLIKSVKIIQK